MSMNIQRLLRQPCAALVSAGLSFFLVIFSLAACDDDKNAPSSNENELNANGGDYLPATLRSKIEKLKADIEKEPTNSATAKERAAIVYDWINAYSLTGGKTNSESLVNVAIAMGYAGPFDPIRDSSNIGKALDQCIREMSLRESSSNAIGKLVTDNPGPVTASSFTTIHLTYTVGDNPIVAGGGILVSQHLLADWRFQATEPKADNYVSIKSSNAGVKFEVGNYLLKGIYGMTRWTPEPIVFRLKSGTLNPGDKVTITYGDTSGGGKGVQVQSMSVDRAALPVFIDFKGNDDFVFLPLVPLEVVGGPAKGVHGFAPSIVAVGERIDVHVRTEDWSYNRATGPIPAYKVFLNGKPYGDIGAGANAISVIRGITFKQPGIYRFTFEAADGAYKGIANPIVVDQKPAQRVYWGETHGHTEFADGSGTPDSYMRFGRDEARLDFLTHSEHDVQVDAWEWNVMKANAEKYTKEGEFIAFLGYEWSSPMQMGGHHNVLFRTPKDRKLIAVQNHLMPEDLYRGLAENNNPDDIMIIPHAHEPGNWNFNDARMERLIEIMSTHGTFEWFAEEYLKRAYEVGFVGAGDDHLAHPGYSGLWNQPLGMLQPSGLAAVLAPSKTTDAIFDNFRARHTYATTGERLVLSAKVNGTMMGERAPFSPQRMIESKIIGTGALDNIRIMKNGKILKEIDLATNSEPLPKSGKTRLQVSFYSPSLPPEGDRRPRATRAWQGQIQVTGAKLTNATADDFKNPRMQWIKPDFARNNIVYRTISHGFLTSVILDLEDAGPSTRITVTVDPFVETEGVSASSLVAKKTERKGEKIIIALGNLKAGKLEKNFDMGKGIVDTLSLRVLKNDETKSYDLRYTDNDSTGVGDYYYIRVRQLDGALAWTSPVWVGGKSRLK